MRSPDRGQQLISLRPLKELVLAELPPKDLLRNILLSERDELTPQEFLAKLEVWLAIRRERRKALKQGSEYGWK